METEPEEMQILGLGGIFMEAIKILRSYSRLLLSLAGTLVLPLCIVIFSHSLISNPLWRKVFRNERLVEAEQGTPEAAKTERILDMELVGLAILSFVYVMSVLLFSLLSTAAIVYSVASIYTGKGLSYFKVISVVPKVWKRLAYTFIWAYLVIAAYYVALFALVLMVVILHDVTGITMVPFLIPLTLFFYAMLVYLNLVWHLASVVSVLEDSYGLGALKKSVNLIKGKKLEGFGLMFIYFVCTFLILWLFRVTVVYHKLHMSSVAGRVILGILLLALFTAVTLLGILVQSVLYFTCKSYHHESIDRYALSEHLDGYLGEYMPLKGPVSLEALEAELEEI